MKRTAPLKRRSRLRARRKPAKVIEADIWREGLGPCAVCGARYNVDAHHIVYAQTLRRHGLGEHVMRKENRLALCRRHHARHHSGMEPVPRCLLPEAVFAFAAEVGLTWWLDKHYGPADQAEAA